MIGNLGLLGRYKIIQPLTLMILFLVIFVPASAITGLPRQQATITPLPAHTIEATPTTVGPAIDGMNWVAIDVYYADARESPGSVYYAQLRTTPGSPYYTRPNGNIYSFAFHPGVPEKLYFVNANDNKIYMIALTGGGFSAEQTVYTHNTYVRDIAFALDSAGDLRLYFSEATGEGSNGMIYKLESDGSATPFYEVNLSDVSGLWDNRGGYWAGDFAFDAEGNLYLSSGNHIPASIYRVRNRNVVVENIYTDRADAIKGMIVSGGQIYYANWRDKIYMLDLTSGTKNTFYTDSTRAWTSDVGFKRTLGPDEMPKAGDYWLPILSHTPTIAQKHMTTFQSQTPIS